jgi:hypothetical protein
LTGNPAHVRDCRLAEAALAPPDLDALTVATGSVVEETRGCDASAFADRGTWSQDSRVATDWRPRRTRQTPWGIAAVCFGMIDLWPTGTGSHRER